MKVSGIDPSATPSRCSGHVILDTVTRRIASVDCLHSDDELTAASMDSGVVAVDAPLSLTSSSSFRDVDRVVIRSGFKLLPPAWASMRRLSERAIKLACKLRSAGAIVIETHPHSSLIASGCRSYERLLDAAGISHMGVPDDEDLLDAMVASLTAYYHLFKLTSVYAAVDGTIHILPRLCPPSWPP